MNFVFVDSEKPPPRGRWKIYSLVATVLVGLILANTGVTASTREYWGLITLIAIIDLSCFFWMIEKPCVGCKAYREALQEFVKSKKEDILYGPNRHRIN